MPYFLFSCFCNHYFIGSKPKGQCSKCGTRLDGKKLANKQGTIPKEDLQ